MYVAASGYGVVSGSSCAIPATLVVGFTTGGPIFEVFQVLAEDFKIVRFSLVLFVRLLCQ